MSAATKYVTPEVILTLITREHTDAACEHSDLRLVKRLCLGEIFVCEDCGADVDYEVDP
jgi:ribosomal protein L37AE/L43A